MSLTSCQFAALRSERECEFNVQLEDEIIELLWIIEVEPFPLPSLAKAIVSRTIQKQDQFVGIYPSLSFEHNKLLLPGEIVTNERKGQFTAAKGAISKRRDARLKLLEAYKDTNAAIRKSGLFSSLA